MKSKFNSRKCSFERKTNKALKLSGIALLGALFCVPCLKYEGVIDEIPSPKVLTYDINYRIVDDDVFNIGLIVNSITYESGHWYLNYSIPIDLFGPYTAYQTGAVEFTYYGDGGKQFTANCRTGYVFDNVIDYYLPNLIDVGNPGIYDFRYSVISNGNYYRLSSFVYENDVYSDTVFTFDVLKTDYPLLANVEGDDAQYLMNCYSLLNSSDTAYQNGVLDGIDYVLNHLSDYNLYTQQQYLAYGASQYELGLANGSDVLSLSGLVREIFKAPVTMFGTIFDWQLVLPDGEVINVLPIMTFLLTIGIALAVVHLIMKVS